MNVMKMNVMKMNVMKSSRLAKSVITVSASASARIITMFSGFKPSPDNPISIRGIRGIRVSINKRGCNGMNYVMKYITDTKTVAKDEKIRIADGIHIYIDPSAVFAIVGSVMDWKEDALVSEFTFRNPNAKGVCGCGDSFNM